jgi:hypothetical protein
LEEQFTLSVDAQNERGWVAVPVLPGVIGSEPIYNAHIRASHKETIVVRVPSTGLYRVAANYLFGFRGRNT